MVAAHLLCTGNTRDRDDRRRCIRPVKRRTCSLPVADHFLKNNQMLSYLARQFMFNALTWIKIRYTSRQRVFRSSHTLGTRWAL